MLLGHEGALMKSINSLRRAAIAIVLVIATLFGAMAITPAGPADATYEPPTIAFGRLEAIATAGNAGGDPVVNFFAIDSTYSDPFGAIRFRNTTDDRFRGQVDCMVESADGSTAIGGPIVRTNVETWEGIGWVAWVSDGGPSSEDWIRITVGPAVDCETHPFTTGGVPVSEQWTMRRGGIRIF